MNGLEVFRQMRSGRTEADFATLRAKASTAAQSVAEAAALIDAIGTLCEGEQAREPDAGLQRSMERCIQTYAGLSRDLWELQRQLRALNMEGLRQFRDAETQLLNSGP